MLVSHVSQQAYAGGALLLSGACLVLLLQPFAVAAIVTGDTHSIAQHEQQQQEQQPHQQLDLEAPLVSYAEPHFLPKRTAIVELFEWKYADVAAECVQFLGPKGYAGVQLSPVTEHLVLRHEHLQRPWWERYHPVSYQLATRSGDAADFLQMSHACNAAGVRVYVDVVLNHMASAYDDATASGVELLQGTAGATANASSWEYPAVPYTSADFHKPCALVQYTDAYEVRNCQLDGRPDLDHSRVQVRRTLVALLDKLVDMGVAGFRLDAAKYMWPIDVKLIFKEVKNLNTDFGFPENARPLVYQDVLDLGIDGISKTEYSSYGLVTEYLYAAELSTILSGQVPLSSLINWGPAMGFLPHQDALVFVDSHDGQRGPAALGHNHLLTHRQRHKYIMANVFMLAHPYGRIKRIMSSYRYAADNVDQGPPVADENDELIRTPEFDEQSQCTAASGWVCEHRWPAIVRMIALANSLCDREDGVINFQTNGPHHIAFCRGHKAFIAMNNDAELAYVSEVDTCLEPGVYCDVISGGRAEDGASCVGKRVLVDVEGKANIELLPVVVDYDNEDVEGAAYVQTSGEEYGVLAIYVGAKLEDDVVGGGKADAELIAVEKMQKVAETTEVEEIEKELSQEELEKSAKLEDEATDASVEHAEKEGEEAADDEEEKAKDNAADEVDETEAEVEVNAEEEEEEAVGEEVAEKEAVEEAVAEAVAEPVESAPAAEEAVAEETAGESAAEEDEAGAATVEVPKDADPTEELPQADEAQAAAENETEQSMRDIIKNATQLLGRRPNSAKRHASFTGYTFGFCWLLMFFKSIEHI